MVKSRDKIGESKFKITSMNIPIEFDDAFNLLIANGNYKSISELVRFAVREFFINEFNQLTKLRNKKKEASLPVNLNTVKIS